MEIIYMCLSIASVYSGYCVVGTKNPVYGVLFLIQVFVYVMGLVMLIGLDFISLVILLVYVGAVAVLFLFIVMMLNVKVLEISEERLRYLPLSLSVVLLFLFEIFVINVEEVSMRGFLDVDTLNIKNVWVLREIESNITILGNVLYTVYVYYFIVASLILLLAMVGAICITYKVETQVKKQKVYKQMERDYLKSIKILC